MKALMVTTDFPDLYRFLNALIVVSHDALPANDFGLQTETPGVLIWSPEANATLLDTPEKLELVQRYALKCNVSITLSAANDPILRDRARETGWNVLWDIPTFNYLTPTRYENLFGQGFTGRPEVA